MVHFFDFNYDFFDFLLKIRKNINTSIKISLYMHLTRYVLIFLIINLFTISISPSFIHAQPDIRSMNLSDLSFNQKLSISIDTSHPQATHQPIDIHVTFDQPCWAKNETQHSIRVAYHDGDDYNEIESQIYDLSPRQEGLIESCSIVFLIPEDADGKETYHIFYSDKETSAPSYPDHISVVDTRYFYEPITGQIMDFEYYQINEDDNVIYGICQKGELLGNGMSNAVVKLLPESKEFATKNAEQIAGFYTGYSINPPGEHTGTQWAKDISKSILVEGNLMTRIRIKGTAPNEELTTDNIYTYYYSPTDTKRLLVSVNHQTLKDIQVQGTQQREGTLASLSTIKSRSGTINDMNLGEIFPKIHFFGTDETIIDYDIPTDPDVHPAEWILGYSDDQKLGDKAWLSFDDPATGRANGLIFEKHTGIVEGNFDGIQVKASVNQHVNLPGLVASTGDVYAMRNAYENNEHRTTLSKGENIHLKLLYLSLQTGGYEVVDRESELFQTLVKDIPIIRGNETIIEEPGEKIQRYTVKASVHGTFSAPLGSLLSAALGRNISYLTAELHKTTTMVSSGSVGRLKFNSLDLDIEDDATFIEKIQAVRSLFDFKNSTFFRSISFTDVEPGSYLIKIYKENPARYNQRQFIGFTVVSVTEDTSTRINCKKQTTVETTITDQNEKPIEAAEARIFVDDVLISRETTDNAGKTMLSLPLYTNQEFTLQTIYDGFLIDEETISLSVLNRFRPWKTEIAINRYDLTLTVTDTLGLPPGIDPRPMLRSNEMIQETNIAPMLEKEGFYQFNELYEATYDLTLKYKSWEFTETVSLTEDKTLDIMFPAEFNLETTTLNHVGNPIEAADLILKREGKIIKTTINEEGIGIISAPPGTYMLTISTDEATIAAQQVTLKGDRSIQLVSNQPSSIHQSLPLILILLGIAIAGLLYWKTGRKDGVYILIAFIVLTSLFLPWWQLQGQSNSVETTSETYLYPPVLITRTEDNSIIGGEISEVPEIFTTVLSLLALLSMVASVLIMVFPFILKRFQKISWFVLICILVLLILNIALFWVTMSEVTKIGIGDFFGSGDLSISLPGESDQQIIPSTWGAGNGLYLIIVALIGIFPLRFFPLIQKKLNLKRNKF